MSLRVKFNIVMFVCSVIGIASMYGLYRDLAYKKLEVEMNNTAQVILDISESIRSFHEAEIRPLIINNSQEFVKQSVTSYVASHVFKENSIDDKLYKYKVAILDSDVNLYKTNIWQKEIIEHFIDNPNQLVYFDRKSDELGRFLIKALPLKNEKKIIGAKIVMLYEHPYLFLLNQELMQFIMYITVIILLLVILFNFIIHIMILKPITVLSNHANDISRGKSDLEELPINTSDDIGLFSQSFNRMQRSLKAAMNLLNK